MPLDSAKAPVIADMQALDNYTVWVRWSDGPRSGSSNLIDLSEIVQKYKMYMPLRKHPSKFLKARLVNGGRVVAWGDDDEIDITADDLLWISQKEACEEIGDVVNVIRHASYANVFVGHAPIVLSDFQRINAEAMPNLVEVLKIRPLKDSIYMAAPANDPYFGSSPAILEVAV